MCPHSKTNSESTSWVLSMSMKGLDGYFPNMQFELSSVSLSVHRSARSGSRAENCIVHRARAGADAHFSGLGQLWAVCSSWNLVHGSSLLLLHLVRVGMSTSDSQCHDTAAMAGRRSRGRRREQVFFSLCRKATCLENYLCRP